MLHTISYVFLNSIDVFLIENVRRSKIDKSCLPPLVAYSSAPNDRYIWNKYLLDPVRGFDGEGVGEQNISQV